jgi:hypothetical protein
MNRFALSIQPPWTWAILHAGKDVENRAWRPPASVEFPFRLVIHASLTWDFECIWLCRQNRRLGHILHKKGLTVPFQVPKGALVGEVTVTNVVAYGGERLVANPWAFGPWCWILADPVEYAEPIPYKGRLGLFEVEID